MTKFFIDQHGCAKNQTDGEQIAGFLLKNNFEYSQNPEEADFIIINSCGFIESAKKESIDAVYNVKSNYPKAKIVLAGCLAERYAEDLKKSMPELDGIFGNGDLSKIVEFMDECSKKKTPVKKYPQDSICNGERPLLFNYPSSAYVKITEGCSNHCSFCAIPLIRGELRSRPVQEIIKEIHSLVDDGVYEINLIGQDLAAFEINGTPSLPELFAEISKIKGEFIIRPLYIHPDHFDSEILTVMKKDSRFIPYFDIPFQSGDDSIIKAMNRTGTSLEYIGLVNTIRKEYPQAVLRTTFLVGFPGETEKAAENTRDFLMAIKPDWSGAFAYSREENTPAYNLKGRTLKTIVNLRINELEKIQSEITTQKLESYVGNELDVLVEEIIDVIPEYTADISEGLAIGRAWFQAPDVDGSVVIRYDRDDAKQMLSVKSGNIVKVKILAVSGVDLDARFVGLKRKFEPANKRNYLF